MNSFRAIEFEMLICMRATVEGKFERGVITEKLELDKERKYESKCGLKSEEIL